MKTRVMQNEPDEPATADSRSTVGDARRTRRRNLAARMGRWSASHRKTAIFGWLAFVVVAFVRRHRRSAPSRSTRTTRTSASPHTPTRSSRTPAFRRQARQQHQEQGEFVLIQSKTLTVDDPAFRVAIADAVNAVAAFPQVSKLASPFARGRCRPDLQGRPLGAGRSSPRRATTTRRRCTSTTIVDGRRQGRGAPSRASTIAVGRRLDREGARQG